LRRIEEAHAAIAGRASIERLIDFVGCPKNAISNRAPASAQSIMRDSAQGRRPRYVRIFETLLHRAGNELLNFRVAKKGSTPDPSQL
jgi:hypothetical protein